LFGLTTLVHKSLKKKIFTRVCFTLSHVFVSLFQTLQLTLPSQRLNLSSLHRMDDPKTNDLKKKLNRESTISPTVRITVLHSVNRMTHTAHKHRLVVHW